MEQQLEHLEHLEDPRASARPTRTPDPPRYVWGANYRGAGGVSPQAVGHRLAQLPCHACPATPRPASPCLAEPALPSLTSPCLAVP